MTTSQLTRAIESTLAIRIPGALWLCACVLFKLWWLNQEITVPERQH